jgi:hypothetical protein
MGSFLAIGFVLFSLESPQAQDFARLPDRQNGFVFQFFFALPLPFDLFSAAPVF